MAKKLLVGRPSVEVRKKPLPVMLDPRYIDHLKKLASDADMNIQDMVRKALYDYFPNPYKPKAGEGLNVPKIKPPKG